MKRLLILSFLLATVSPLTVRSGLIHVGGSFQFSPCGERETPTLKHSVKVWGSSNHQMTTLPSLVLDPVTINDGGLYELQCNGTYRERTQLEVSPPVEVSAVVGDNVTLPGHVATVGEPPDCIVRWERNGKTVVEGHLGTGNVTVGEGFDQSRVALPPNWVKTGDFSLHIGQAEASHGGAYYLVVTNKLDTKLVTAALLKVISSPREDSPCHPRSDVTIAAVTPTAFFLLCCLLYLIHRGCKPGSRKCALWSPGGPDRANRQVPGSTDGGGVHHTSNGSCGAETGHLMSPRDGPSTGPRSSPV